MDNQDCTETHNSAQNSTRIVGKPFTKETAKKAQLSAAKVRKMRTKVRGEMVARLAQSDGFSFAEEFFKAIKSKDEDYLNLLEKASRMVGFNFDQSEDASHNLNVKSDAKVKSNNVVKFVMDDGS